MSDLVILLFRSKWLMLSIFVPLLLMALAAGLLLPQSHMATARLLVSSPDGLLYRPPVLTSEANLLLPDNDAAVSAERALLLSPSVAKAALEKVALSRAYPDVAGACQPDDCERQGLAAIFAGLDVSASSGSPVVVVRLRHREAAIATELLGAVIDAYLDYRGSALAGHQDARFDTVRQAFERELSEADGALHTFLQEHGLSDFAAERDTTLRLYQASRAELQANTLALRGQTARLDSYRKQIAAIPRDPESDAGQPADDVGGGGLADLRHAQRAADIAALQSEVQTLRVREAALEKRIADLDTRQLALAALAPEFDALQRRRDLAAEAVRRLAGHAAEVRALADLSPGGIVSITLLEPASLSEEAKPGRSLWVTLSALVAALAALCAGLAQALSRPGLPTAGAVERTLGLPVLATVRAS